LGEESVRRVSLEWIQQQMSPEWITVGVAAGSMVVGLVTLVVAVLVLGSARRSEQTGEERLEMLHEQRERLNYLHEERRLLLEELAEERRRLEEVAGGDHNAGQRAWSEPSPQEGPVSATSESGAEGVERAKPRPSTGAAQGGAGRPKDVAMYPVRGSLTRPWWRRVFGG
jgi:hypothetical protein